MLEHKSQYNRAVFYQLLSYQTFIVGQAFQETGEACIVIPVLFYHGKEAWRWKTSFQEGFLGEILTKIPISLRKNVLNYEPRLLDTHDPKVERVIGDPSFKVRGALNALKSAWDFKADEAMLSEALSLFDNWTGDKGDLLLNLGNYFWSVVPGMTKELWARLENLADEASPWQATGYRLWLYHQIPTFSKANAL